MKNTSQSLKNRSVPKSFLLLYALILSLTLGIILIHSHITKIQKSDSIRINLAGRQRMLTQKISKEVLQYSRGAFPKEDILQTARVFETTLYALLEGGSAPLDLTSKTLTRLPEMEDPATRLQLSKVVGLWKPFKDRVTVIIRTRDDAALNYILQNNSVLLSEMDSAVFMMQNTGEKNNQLINRILYVMSVFTILTFTALLTAKLHQLKHASLYIGRLESILPICMNCKKIRETDAAPQEQKSWTPVESYIETLSGSAFSHSICPSCAKELYGDEKWFPKMERDLS